MDVSKEFIVKGKWFLPYKENDYCYGELSYSFKNGFELFLYGSLFKTANIFETKNNIIIDCIWGNTEDGKCITILNATIQELGSSQLIRSEISLEFACISSTHFLTLETDLFDFISLNLNCNESFFSSLYNRMKIDESEGNGDIRKFIIENTPPKELFKNESQAISLNFSYNTSFSSKRATEFEFSQNVYFNTEFNSPILFKDTITHAYNIRSLFSFFSRYKVYLNKISLREKESGEYFEILFPQDNKSSIKKLSVGDLIIQYNELNGGFENVLQWWINHTEFVNYGLSLYQQLIYSSGLSSTQKFINIALALETLHSTFFDKKNFLATDYQIFKNQAENFQMDEIFKPRFRECIGNFNELSFKKRILDLCESSNNQVKSIIGNYEDFSIKIRNQRNYYAHKHSEERSNLIQPKHLDYYTFMCKAIYETVFLKIIGISDEKIELMLKRDFIFKYYKNKKPQE